MKEKLTIVTTILLIAGAFVLGASIVYSETIIETQQLLQQAEKRDSIIQVLDSSNNELLELVQVRDQLINEIATDRDSMAAILFRHSKKLKDLTPHERTQIEEQALKYLETINE